MKNTALMMYGELDGLCILLLIYIIFKSFRNIESRESWRYFQCSLFFITIFLISDLVWALMEYDAIPSFHPLPHIINSIYFMSSVMGTGYWFLYTEAELKTNTIKKPHFRLLTSMPIPLMAILLIINCFNGCLFYFDENGYYIRGSLNILSFIVPLIYLFASIIHPLTRAFKKQYYVNRKNYIYLSLFALITTLTSILQMLVPHTPLPCIGISTAVLLVYLNTQDHLISLDPLTQLKNRHHMIRYLSYKMDHADESHPLFLLIVDLDQFKNVNDTYGHVEGDRALVRLANILKEAAAIFNCFTSRYGGDEFIIIYEPENPSDIDKLCSFIHTRLEESNHQNDAVCILKTSIGYARYTDDIKYVPEFIALADRSLYKEKRRKKKTTV